jgi:hypothetical protein
MHKEVSRKLHRKGKRVSKSEIAAAFGLAMTGWFAFICYCNDTV